MMLFKASAKVDDSVESCKENAGNKLRGKGGQDDFCLGLPGVCTALGTFFWDGGIGGQGFVGSLIVWGVWGKYDGGMIMSKNVLLLWAARRLQQDWPWPGWGLAGSRPGIGGLIRLGVGEKDPSRRAPLVLSNGLNGCILSFFCTNIKKHGG